jgi:serine/threonine-protein kinase
VVVAALGVATVTWKAGRAGGAENEGALAAVVARANDARLQKRWDSPPGDNVRDVTDDGLSRWPNNGKLVAVRALTCDDIVDAARAKHETGDVNQALDLARIAVRLDPSSRDANALIAQWSREPELPPVAASDTAVPPLAAPRATPVAIPAGALPVAPVRVAVDASSARPAVGQPVSFVAREVGPFRTALDDPHFRVAGPGLATGTEMPVSGDGAAVPRATFTFLQPGRFEVSFSARAAGGPVFAVRSVVVGDPAPPPVPAPGAAQAAGTPAKWL